MRKFSFILIPFFASSCGSGDTSAYEKQIQREFAVCSARADMAADSMAEYKACKKEKGLNPGDRITREDRYNQ